MTTIDTAARLPIRLVESGPAGGAILAARIARSVGEKQVISFDMGGTTAKLCLIDHYQPQTARKFEIARAARFIKGSGMPVRIAQAGFDVKDSFTNFLLIRFKSDTLAQTADAALRADGINLRLQSGAGLGHCLRMTIGPKDDNTTAAYALISWAEKEKT